MYCSLNDRCDRMVVRFMWMYYIVD